MGREAEGAEGAAGVGGTSTMMMLWVGEVVLVAEATSVEIVGAAEMNVGGCGIRASVLVVCWLLTG